MDGNLTYNSSGGTDTTSLTGDGSNAMTGIGGTDFIHSDAQINNSVLQQQVQLNLLTVT